MTDTAQQSGTVPEFAFWVPPENMTLSIEDDEDLEIPQVPLPLRAEECPAQGQPTEKAIGDGLYEYLCLFPDAEHAAEYARILQRAYPFLISDIASDLLLLDFKEVDSDGLRRKAALLKILLQVTPEHFGLLQKLGIACYDLALNYAELHRVRDHLAEARRWLEKARRQRPEDLTTLNYLGQICYLNGAYHQARLYWQIALKSLEEEASRQVLEERLERIAAGRLPDTPLVEDLAATAEAVAHYNQGCFAEASATLEELDKAGRLYTELPNAEFYYLLGLCRQRCADRSGAFRALQTALDIDPQHAPTRAVLEALDNDRETDG